MSKRILGIVGSYRRGGIVDSLVSEVLTAAESAGATTEKIYLIDQNIEFCENCRTCTQEPGEQPGECVKDDDMRSILARYDESDAVVLGAPVNFFNVNALTRRFMERLVCYAYWPWGAYFPKDRSKAKTRKAVLVTSSAMPAAMGRVFTGAVRALKLIAHTMGAKPIATIYAGMIAVDKKAAPPKRAVKKAQAAGRRLAGR